MTYQISWTAITGICALLSFIGVGLALYIKSVVRSEMSDAIAKINGTYTRAQMCQVLHDQLEQRFQSLENRLDMVEDRTL